MKALETERLILRAWNEEDYADLYEYARDERVGPNAGWPPHKSEEESKQVIKSFMKSEEVYAVVLKSENKVIGGIGLHNRKPDKSLEDLHQREIGYALSPKYWGRGYIPEAVKQLIKYGFEELQLDIIWCGHSDFNQNSKRVVEKCGFQYRFTRNVIKELLDNEIVNNLYYSITRDDYINENLQVN